jgi:hypothetical protein
MNMYSFNEKDILEVLGPDNSTKIGIAQSLNHLREQLLQRAVVTDSSAANRALLYVIKHFAVPQMRAHHWETIATLLATSPDTQEMNSLKALVEMFLGREIERTPEEEPVVEEPVEEPVAEETPEETPVEEPVVEPTPEPEPEPVVTPEPEVEAPPAEQAPEPEVAVEVVPEPVAEEPTPVAEEAPTVEEPASTEVEPEIDPEKPLD